MSKLKKLLKVFGLITLFLSVPVVCNYDPSKDVCNDCYGTTAENNYKHLNKTIEQKYEVREV